MEIRLLRYFLFVAREESISKAAQALHITQPTLSRQMAQLEEEIGVPLFHRSTRGFGLTDEGILLRRRAEEILGLVEKTEKELAQNERTLSGTVSVGCGEVAAVERLAELFDGFSKAHPLVDFDVCTADADRVRESLDRGLLDLGLLLEPANIEKYAFIRMPVEERWGVLMRVDDPLSEKEAVSAEDLKRLPLIMTRRPGVRSELAAWFGGSAEQLHVRITSNMSTNAAVMVQQGLGYALIIEGSMPFADPEKICYRPLTPQLVGTTVLAWKWQQPLSPAVKAFIEHAQRTLRTEK